MQVIHTIHDCSQQVKTWKQQGLSVAFVPTMGNLHAGHLSLLALAKSKADKVVVSIFVNPLQFGEGEDFSQYPRTLEQDCKQLDFAGCDLLFAPKVNEMYPQGALTKVVAPNRITTILEGESRPGHFDGVTTVVNKLFNIVLPDIAIFGQKDYQQWCVLKKMVTDLAMPIKMICAPIVRAEDGLALSSRNQYLSSEQRKIAPTLQQELLKIRQQISSPSFSQNFAEVESQACDNLIKSGFDGVDYIRIVCADSLMPANKKTTNKVVLSVARLGSTRLLDNVLYNILDPTPGDF